VHLFGNVVDIPRLREIVGDIPIIEDALKRMAAPSTRQKAGTMGDMGVFSFYPTKNWVDMATAERLQQIAVNMQKKPDFCACMAW